MAFSCLDPVLDRGDILLFGKPRFYQLIRGRYPQDIWIPKGRSFWGNWWRLFRSGAYTAVLLPNSFSSALHATLAGMKAVGVPADFRGFLLNKRVLVKDSLHQAEIYRRVLEAAGLSVPLPLSSRLYLSREDEEWAEEKLRNLGWENTPIFIIHPGASKPERCWPVERFSEVAKRVSERGFAVVVVGGGADAERGRVIERAVKGPFLNIAAENPPLGRLAAFIKRGSVFLGNDSGPLHIAAAVGLRCVGIYGTSIPEKTGPILNKNAHFIPVCSRYPCSPCRERFFKDCQPVGGVPPCIDAISVEMVWEAVASLL